jgi:hypothetical protein
MNKLSLLALISSAFGSFVQGAVVNIPSTSYGPRMHSGATAVVPSGPIANTIIYTLSPTWIIETVIFDDGSTQESWKPAASITTSSSPLEVQVLMNSQTNTPKQIAMGSMINSLASGTWTSNWQDTFLEMTPSINFFAFRIKASALSYYYGYEVLEFEQYQYDDNQLSFTGYRTKGLGRIQTTANASLIVTTPEPSVLTMSIFSFWALLFRRKR